jgi:hypothetical protein
VGKSFFSTDERMSVIAGRIAVAFLSLTQLALLGSILYRQFILGQDEEQYSDIRLILLLSVFGFIAARLYYGAALPIVSIRTLAKLYVFLAVSLFVVLSLWLGFPNIDNWQDTLLPVVLGPAILLGAYWVFSFFGNKRMEKSLEEE